MIKNKNNKEQGSTQITLRSTLMKAFKGSKKGSKKVVNKITKISSIGVNANANDIIKIIYDITGETVTNDQDLTQTDIDSLDRVEIILAIEEKYNITIPDNVIESLNTVSKIVSYIN
jgi:acyl carrier protein